MWAILVALIAIPAALLFWYIRNLYGYWKRRGVPYEEPIFPFGNAKGIGKTVSFRDIDKRLYDRFKGTSPFMGSYFLFTKAAMILDLELIKHIMIKDFSNFRDRGVYSNPHDDPLSAHLFSLDGEQWHSLRLKLSPVFTSGKMKFMFKTMVDVSERLIEACNQIKIADKGGALDLKELCARYTTDVIGTCAFGLECNSLKDPNAEFRLKGRAFLEKPRHSPLVQAFIITNPDLARKLHIKLFPDDVSDFFMNAVRSTVDYRLKNNIKRNDFMDLLIEMKALDEEAARKGNGIDLSHGLTLEQIAAQAFVFFVAGFDTSSATMAFCLYELALNEDIQEKLRSEITEVLGNHEGKITYEAVKEMTYLEQVLAETLRKHSILPHHIRRALHDYKVPNSNLVIEAGTTILIPAAAIQNDPEYFPEPQKFDPSRFEPEQIVKRHAMTYLPFGDGPRNCIGLRFGKMQAKVGLINLLKHYKFSKSARTEIPLELDTKNFIIAAKNGIYLKVEKL